MSGSGGAVASTPGSSSDVGYGACLPQEIGLVQFTFASSGGMLVKSSSLAI